MMKKFIIILITLSVTACSTKSDYCNLRHPHDGSIVVDVAWNAIVEQQIEPPLTMQMYMWKSDQIQPSITTSDSYEFVCPMPTNGNYNAMLLSDNTQNTVLAGLESYNTAKIVVPQYIFNQQTYIGAADIIYIADLGAIDVKNTQTIFLDTQAKRVTRLMKVKIAMDNASLLANAAYIVITNIAPEVSLYNNKATNNATMRVPVEVKSHSLETQVAYCGVGDQTNEKVIFQLVIEPKIGTTQNDQLDITQQIIKYEQTYTDKIQPLIVDAEVQTSKGNGGFAFKFGSMNVNQDEVQRGGLAN